MIIRDLTLRSAASFGSFHLIRLLYDEYMFYLVEHKVSKAIGASPISVMGEVSTLTIPLFSNSAKVESELASSAGNLSLFLPFFGFLSPEDRKSKSESFKAKLPSE